LLETPETEWLPHMDPQEAVQFAELHPDHGPREAFNKILHVYNYGPDYRQASAMLQLLAKYWNVTMDDLLTQAKESAVGHEGADQNMIDAIHNVAPQYGIQ